MQVLTPEQIANLLLLIAPGYIAFKVYNSLFNRRQYKPLEITIISISLSLPLYVGLRALIDLVNRQLDQSLFILILLAVSSASGIIFGKIRCSRRLEGLFRWFNIDHPQEDFFRLMRGEFSRNATYIVRLKTGAILSGRLHSGNTGKDKGPREIVIANAAWYDKSKKTWKEAGPLSVYLNLKDVRFIEINEDPFTVSSKS